MSSIRSYEAWSLNNTDYRKWLALYKS